MWNNVLKIFIQLQFTFYVIFSPPVRFERQVEESDHYQSFSWENIFLEANPRLFLRFLHAYKAKLSNIKEEIIQEKFAFSLLIKERKLIRFVRSTLIEKVESYEKSLGLFSRARDR